MTATPILEALAREQGVDAEAVRAVLEMLDAGLTAPFIGRCRRARTGGLSEGQIRKLQLSRGEFEELDRRRGTILRALEREEGLAPSIIDSVTKCMDRFELEDLFVPHRRPEPEVQLAMDRGLDALADQLVKPMPKPAREARAPKDDAPDGTAPEVVAAAEPAVEAAPTEAPAAEAAPVEAVPAEAAAVEAPATPEATPEPDVAPEAPVAADEPAAAEAAPAEAAPAEPAPAEAASGAEEPPTADAVATEASQPTEPAKDGRHTVAVEADVPGQHGASTPARVAVTPELARLCQPFVNPDKGIHTEIEALAGAMRILSDRLGRNSGLRGQVRKMMAKRGTLRVRPLVDPKQAGRHKPLLKLNQPLKQVQGHRLIAIRQAQKERAINTLIELDTQVALPKVRQALGRRTDPAFEEVLHEVARRALEARLLPVIEEDVRLELKERGDAEALRFLGSHLRQVLLSPPQGRHPAVGVDVSAKGDWILARLDGEGNVGAKGRIETEGKDAAALGAELVAFLEDSPARALVVSNGRGPRAQVASMRAALEAGSLGQVVVLATEAGLSNYANSEIGRRELPDCTVPERAAVSLGRRFQDPMSELLKVDPRHLSLGSEQGLVSKANLRRVLDEATESAVAHTGCVLNQAPASVLRQIPGLDDDRVEALLARRAEKPFTSREELRTEGLLNEVQWTNAIGFLRVPESSEPLDKTSLHPELYPIARKLLESSGQTVQDGLGRPGATKGLRRQTFELDEVTWRDLMRELSFPGRDPRFRNHLPEFLHRDTDPIRITEGRVVEGVITNVTSFGAFVDIGLANDAMIHISQLSQRYLRDARETLSVGQCVRAKITDPKGQRMALTLKDVPPVERAPRARREGGGGARRDGGGRDGGGRDGGRRGGGKGRERDRGGRPGDARGMILGDGSGRSKRGPGARRDDRKRESVERVDLKQVNANAKQAAFNPFAKFFKASEPEPEAGQVTEAKPDKKPKQPKSPEPKAAEPQVAESPVAEPTAADQAATQDAPATENS